MQVIEFPLESGGVIAVQVPAEDAVGPAPAGRGIGERAEETFETVVSRVGPAANALFNALREVSQPRHIAIEFGVKLSAKSGVVLASADAEATFKVSLTWEATPA